MFNFIDALKYLFSGGSNQEASQPEQQQEQINAASGDNVRFAQGTDMSENYGNVLSDAVKFYQDEFKMTPRATIFNDPEALPGDEAFYATGTATRFPDKTGQYAIDFRFLTEEDEESDKRMSSESEALGVHPKNSGDIASTPVHELGHALFGTLFPENDTSSNRKGEYSDGKFYPKIADDLYYDALSDLGVKYSDNEEDNAASNKEAVKKTNEISKYAGSNPAETVAEALVDFYYNRDNAADLSKAIVKRLKSEGSTYGLRQAGGFDLDSSADNFVKNLRRYRVVQ